MGGDLYVLLLDAVGFHVPREGYCDLEGPNHVQLGRVPYRVHQCGREPDDGCTPLFVRLHCLLGTGNMPNGFRSIPINVIMIPTKNMY